LEPDKIDDHGYTVFCGLDVGKAVHHACALDPSGKRLHDKTLPNDEAALVEIFNKLTVHGSVLVIVDQPASIGALPIAVARSLGIEVAYLPGLAMRRIADLHPGEGKTDARDAYVIADAARTHAPHSAPGRDRRGDPRRVERSRRLRRRPRRPVHSTDQPAP
jgi:transposase